MKKYWAILKKYKAGLIFSPFLVLIGVISETIQPYFMSQIVDNGVMSNDLSVILHTGTVMVLVSIIGLIASIFNIYLSSNISISFGTALRSTLFHKIEQLAFPDIDKFSSASLITRLTNDVTRIQQVIMMSMRIMLRAPMMLIMAIFFIININTDLALILTASIPLLAICVYLILKKGFPFFLIVQQKIDTLNGIVRENLINIRVVKSFVREDFETKKFVKSSEDLRDMVIKASNIIVSLFPVMQLILNLSILAILWFGGIKVINSELKVGELISFVNYLMQVLMALMMLSMVIMTYARASASSERITDVLDTEVSLIDTERGIRENNQIKQGEVAFKNVSFRYPGGETDVLRHINFTIHPGETIAIVGMTGSGKSSLVQLIPRLYDVSEGEIQIDGIPVEHYKLEELHNKIGVVMQKNELFSGSILDNLRWGNPKATKEEIIQATQAAEAHEFIESFDESYQTLLGRGGINLSGGQKQRLCIARALLRKPKILILDDSTSAVDSETELNIRKNLNALLRDTTLLIITQRIHTMQSADRVLVLEDGSVDAIGTPEELMNTSTIYQEIYNSQQIIG